MAETSTPRLKVAELKTVPIERLITFRDAAKIPFPYRNKFSAGDYILSLENEELIQAYRDYRPTFSSLDFRLSFYNTREDLYLPARYYELPVLVEWNAKAEISANMLPILYTDYARVSTALKGKLSLTKAWQNNEVFTGLINRIIASEKATVGFEDFRIQLGQDPNTGEIPCFKPTWVKAIFESITTEESTSTAGSGLKVDTLLDLNAGCGGVMIGSALYGVGQYVGFQPEVAFQVGTMSVDQGKDRILGLDGAAAQLAPGRDFKLYYTDFDASVIKDQLFDVIMSSLPSYNEFENPTVIRYSSYPQWMVGWLFQVLQTSWLSLKEGGYLILHLDDPPGYNLAEPMNLFVEQFLPSSSWQGIIGLENEPMALGAAGSISSVWIWQKVNGGLNTWGLSRNVRGLNLIYSDLANFLMRAYMNGTLQAQTGVARERYDSQLGIINNTLQKIISASPGGVQRDQITTLVREVFADPVQLLPFFLSVGEKATTQWLQSMIRLLTANWNRPEK